MDKRRIAALEYYPALAISTVTITVYAGFFSLRRLEDLGVANKNAGFMFLYGSSIVVGGLGRVNEMFGSAAWLLMVAFLLLTPTETKS